MSPDGQQVDVLVIGGGVQGLTLLDELTRRGYATGLVTNAPVGEGQSLHWHGVLSTGYTAPNPAVRESVVRDWLPALERLGVSTYGNDAWYVLASEEPYRKLTGAWDTHGYPYDESDVDDLPAAYRDGPFGREGTAHVLRIDEHCVDQEALVRALLAGHEGNVVVGDVVDYGFGGGEEPAIETVTVETHDGETIRLEPAHVIAAAGTGTHRLFDSLLSTDGFRAAGGRPTRVREALETVTYRNVHMLTVRGPVADLPAISAYVPPKKLKIVSHPHDHDGEPYVTTYVTNKPLSEVPPEASPDHARGAVDPAHVADGFNKLFAVAPALREAAARADSPVEFCVFAGVKQTIGDRPDTPYAAPVDGLANVGLALPSVMAGVYLSTSMAVDDVTERVTPSGPIDGVPGGGNPPVGGVFDRSDEVEWVDWDGLLERYPAIEQPRVSP